MAESGAKVRIAAVGDLHTRESPSGAHRELLSQICAATDVLVLCGDLTDHGLVREAEVLGEDLITCKIPIVAVLGNHDFESGQQDDIKRVLVHAGVNVLDGETFPPLSAPAPNPQSPVARLPSAPVCSVPSVAGSCARCGVPGSQPPGSAAPSR